MNKKNILLSFFIAVLIIGGWYLLVDESIVSVNEGLNNEVERQEIFSPLDTVSWKVAQAEGQWPKILEAEVHPYKVAVGDTQRMRVVAQSPDGIQLAKAIIDTDNGTTVVDLERVGEVVNYIPNFEIDGNQLVKAYTDEERMQIAREMENGIIPQVMAQSAEAETWEGEWEVQDTHTKFYTTKFVVVDNLDRESEISIGWLDPQCSIPLKGSWAWSSGTCTINDLDGVAKWGSSQGNAILDGGTLTLNNIFVVEGSVNLNGGTLAITQGSGVLDLSSTLYMNDDDGDSYPDSNNLASYNTNATGRTERSQAGTNTWSNADCNDSNATYWYKGYTDSDGDGYGAEGSSFSCNNESPVNNDCYDSDSNVRPAQHNYYQYRFTTSLGWPDGWDWNCSGSIEYQEPIYNSSSCYNIYNSNEIAGGTMNYPFVDPDTPNEYGFICDTMSAYNYQCNVHTNTHGTVRLRRGSCSNPGTLIHTGWDDVRDAYVH